MKTKYNIPNKIIFCQRCVMSNQRPSSLSEFFHTPDRKNAKYLKTNFIYVSRKNLFLLILNKACLCPVMMMMRANDIV